jgi:hypothetical protein
MEASIFILFSFWGSLRAESHGGRQNTQLVLTLKPSNGRNAKGATNGPLTSDLWLTRDFSHSAALEFVALVAPIRFQTAPADSPML